MSSALFAVSASAQNVVPQLDILWSNNFQQYTNGEVLADKATYSTSSKNWRLYNGNSAAMPAGIGATAVTSGGNTYASVRSPYLASGHPSGNFARIIAHSGFSTINWDKQANLFIGGDMQYKTSQNTATSNSEVRYLISGSGSLIADGSAVSYALNYGIDNGKKFNVSFGTATGETSFVSSFEANDSLWYTFVTEVDKNTNIIKLSVYQQGDLDNLIWSASSAGLFEINTISSFEMSVRHARNDRIAGFDNVYIGTVAVPEPATTAAIMLLGVGALVAIKRRRRA